MEGNRWEILGQKKAHVVWLMEGKEIYWREKARIV
jgi:hypothetical protein